jgi:DNA polymerase-3 subunit alpha
MIYFGEVKRNGSMNDYINFENFTSAFITLFTVATADSWNYTTASFTHALRPDNQCLERPSYADYKNNRKEPEYFHPEAKELLHDTYGLMVYQESMMRVAQKFAGYDLAQADNLRKACGKKDHMAMAKEEVVFVEGCEKTGYGRELGETLFGVIRKFADYAFNKSHTFGYGLISYQTAYLKAHFPVEYSASLLTSVKGNYEKAAVHLADCRSMGITVSNPDVNAGRSDFEAISTEAEKRIIFALSAVRNVGEGLVAQIVEERDANGPYESFHDFAKRAPEQALNKRAVESLIKAGGFDSLGHPRRGLLMVFESIIDNAVAKRREEEKGVMSLFGELEEASEPAVCPCARIDSQ